MDEAFVEYSENGIDDHDGDHEQKPETFHRALELGGGALK